MGRYNVVLIVCLALAGLETCVAKPRRGSEGRRGSDGGGLDLGDLLSGLGSGAGGKKDPGTDKSLCTGNQVGVLKVIHGMFSFNGTRSSYDTIKIGGGIHISRVLL